MKTQIFCSILFASSITQTVFAQDWGGVAIRDVGRDEEGYNWIAVEVNLQDGWKTYWKYAGQNGLDPLITITQNDQIIESEIIWPKPKLFIADDLPAIGYKGSTLIPIKFKGDGEMNVSVDIGVCETVCVPTQTEYEFIAQSGYSIEQYILKGTTQIEDGEYCQYTPEQLQSLDANQYWLFANDEDNIITHSQKEIEKIIAENSSKAMAVYAVSEEKIERLPCS